MGGTECLETRGGDAGADHRVAGEGQDSTPALPDADLFRRRPSRLPTQGLLSVVIPMFNECDNVAALVDECVCVLAPVCAFEIICVDDASEDGTVDQLQLARRRHRQLRILRHRRRSGQSAAVRNGVLAARGTWIATLDGDGQNDPADIPRLLALRDGGPPAVRLYAGWRTHRRDGAGKRWASRFANRLRRRLLRDDTPDTGCGIKLFEREAFLDLPAFDHMHRYLPALMQRAGWQVRSVPVGHRPRTAGRSKYGNLDRALAGLADLRGVAWLLRRSVTVAADEVP